MSTIDKQRIAAVRALEALGYHWHEGMGWAVSAAKQAPHADLRALADALHSMAVARADQLEGCTEGSPEEAELAQIATVLDAYEGRRWPDGHVPGGKG